MYMKKSESYVYHKSCSVMLSEFINNVVHYEGIIVIVYCILVMSHAETCTWECVMPQSFALFVTFILWAENDPFSFSFLGGGVV